VLVEIHDLSRWLLKFPKGNRGCDTFLKEFTQPKMFDRKPTLHPIINPTREKTTLFSIHSNTGVTFLMVKTISKTVCLLCDIRREEQKFHHQDDKLLPPLKEYHHTEKSQLLHLAPLFAL
jgi:hypothetical protein